MNRRLPAFIIMTFSASVGFSAPVHLAEDGTLVVDGTRRFPIGLYESPSDDAYTREVAEAGFNLMTCPPDPAVLDRAHRHGIAAWVPLGHLPVGDDNGKTNLARQVNAAKDHPALWVWEAPDEILWNQYYPKAVAFYTEWEDLKDKVETATSEPSDQTGELADAFTRYDTYAMSGRWAEAEAAAVVVRRLLGLPAHPENEPKVSGWHDQVEILNRNLATGCGIVRRLDPGRPIWFNHAPRNGLVDLQKINAHADIAGCDIYPVPLHPDLVHSDMIERDLPAAGAYTRRMAAAAPGKPVWMVLQGFGWGDLHESKPAETFTRPTYQQSRYMAYDAIVHGARGILYYGTRHVRDVEEDSPFWQDLRRVVRELADLESQLAAPAWDLDLRIDYAPTSASRDRGVCFASRGDKQDGIIILVNEHASGFAFDLHGLDNLEGRALTIVDHWERPMVENGAIRFGLRGHSVAVIRVP